jgi:CrcB protein
MIRNILLVGIGGFIGSVSRYLTGLAFIELTHPFPYGTFIINILGSFLIGLVYGAADRSGYLNNWWVLFLATGFCGGFTTFSTFANENLRLLQGGEYFFFALYTILSITLGILAVFGGMALTR